MNHQTFAWDRSRYQLRQQETWRERGYCAGLLLAALLLLGCNLGNLPLLTEIESPLAILAETIRSKYWHIPQPWDAPFFQQPPLVSTSMAIAYTWGGVNAWMARLPSALFTACSVPLVYCLAREVFITRFSSVLTALFYLTALPVVTYGRLATSHGALLLFEILLVLCLLRSRRDLRWSLGIGLSFSALLLTNPLIGLISGFFAAIFLAWDTPRLLTSFYFWLGMTLGAMPAIAWYSLQWHYNQPLVINNLILAPLQKREWLPFNPVEIAKFVWPGLIFAVFGLRLALHSQIWSWAKLILVWSGFYLFSFALLPLEPSLLLMLCFPPLVLAGAIALTEVQQSSQHRAAMKLWTLCFLGFFAGLSTLALSFWFNFPFNWRDFSHRPLVLLTLVSAAFTCLVTAILIGRRNLQFIAVLFWGMYVSLLLFVSSPYWSLTPY